MFSSSIDAARMASMLDSEDGTRRAVWTDSWNEYRAQRKQRDNNDRRLSLIRPSYRVLMTELNMSLKSETHRFIERACETKRYICDKKGYRLEPFQNEIFRAIVASRMDRIFGADASKHRLGALETLGVVSSEDVAQYRYDPGGNTAKRLNRLCDEFSRKYIVVKAPRRSGKNLVSQIAVTALLVHEPNVTVVNWAQTLSCAMLNCEEILQLLEICKVKYPALDYRRTKEGIVVWPHRGLRSILRAKPNTANVS